MSQWKIISQKTVFKAKLFEVKKVVLENEAGIGKIHHDVYRNSIVAIFPLTDRNEIYLLSEYRYTLGKSVLEAVTGHIEKGESTIETAKRELKEEAGISAQQLEEIARIELSGSVFKCRSHLFLAKGLEVGKNSPEGSEEIEVVKMPLKEAVSKVMSGEINNSSTVIGLLMLDKLRTEKKI